MTTTSNTRAGERWAPGPWTIEDNTELGAGLWIGSEHPKFGHVSFAEIRAGCDEARELGNMKANAILMCSAPALYEALRRLLLICEHANEGAFKNDVRIEGSPDQGEVWAFESMDAARAALSLATEGK